MQEEQFCFVHALNAMEVFYHISRKTDVLQAREALRLWTAGGLIERADLDPNFREDAAQLKADWRRRRSPIAAESPSHGVWALNSSPPTITNWMFSPPTSVASGFFADSRKKKNRGFSLRLFFTISG